MLSLREGSPVVSHVLIAASSSGGSSSTALLVSLGLMVVVFYFLLIRPQQRRARAQRDLAEGLSVGDEVITVGGMFATIRALDDDSVTVEVAPGTDIRMLRSAILRKHVTESDAAGEEADETS
jgi:preprotein translocase subunit YajC